MARKVLNPAEEKSRLYIAECRSDSNPSTWYKVTIRRGQWECGCRGWTMHVPRRDCRHITRLKSTLKPGVSPVKLVDAGIKLLADYHLVAGFVSQPIGQRIDAPTPEAVKAIKRSEPVVLAMLSANAPEAPVEDWDAMVAALRSYMPREGWAS